MRRVRATDLNCPESNMQYYHRAVYETRAAKIGTCEKGEGEARGHLERIVSADGLPCEPSKAGKRECKTR
jgi:hypothetical protein